MKKLDRLCLAFALLCPACSAVADEGRETPTAKGAAGIKDDSSAITRSIGAIDEDLGSIDELAGAILGESVSLKIDIERLQARIKELQRVNAEAGDEIRRLNERVATLLDRAKALGERYEELVGIAQGYKTQGKRARIAAFALGATTLALGGVLVGAAVSR